MDTQHIVADLEAERDRLDTAITALQGIRRRNGRRKGKRHTMSAEARRKISLAQKRRWRAQRAKAKA